MLKHLTIPKNGVFSYFTVFKRVNLLCVILFFSVGNLLSGASSQEVLDINENYDYTIIGYHLNFFLDKSKNLTIHDIISSKDSLNFSPVNEESFSRNVGDKAVWFHFKVKNNKSSRNELFMFECQNPDVNNMDVYQVDELGNLRSSFTKMGDFYPFSKRVKEYHTFAFPFFQKTQTARNYYVRVDFNNEPVALPLYWWDFNKFYKSATNKQFIYGAYFAILFIVGAFMSIISLGVRLKIIVNYTFFVFSVTLFVMALSGFSYQYLYPNYPAIRNIAFPLYAGLIAFTFLFFSKEFLQIKKVFPESLKVFNWLGIIMGVQVFACPFFMNSELYKEVFLGIYSVSILLTFIIILTFSFYLLVKTRENKYKIFFIAFIIEIIGLSTFLLSLFDIIELNLFTRFAVYYTALIELIIFTVYLTNMLIGIKRDNLSMSLELSEQKQKALNGIMLGEQSERKRLSNELHDGLGLELSTIKTRLTDIEIQNEKEKNKLNQILKDVDAACNSIRIISHNLAPYKIEEEGLESALKDLFHQLNITYSDIEFKLQYDVAKNELPKFIEVNLYNGTKELIQNIIKHSKASKAHLIIEKNEEGDYLVQMKDNGIGFDLNNENNWGIGLKNIKSRVDYFNGKIDIDSRQGYGTLITIKFSLSDKE